MKDSVLWLYWSSLNMSLSGSIIDGVSLLAKTRFLLPLLTASKPRATSVPDWVASATSLRACEIAGKLSRSAIRSPVQGQNSINVLRIEEGEDSLASLRSAAASQLPAPSISLRSTAGGAFHESKYVVKLLRAIAPATNGRWWSFLFVAPTAPF
jgi:hypothetical protein